MMARLGDFRHIPKIFGAVKERLEARHILNTGVSEP
jgi:hypothetical protein